MKIINETYFAIAFNTRETLQHNSSETSRGIMHILMGIYMENAFLADLIVFFCKNFVCAKSLFITYNFYNFFHPTICAQTNKLTI